MVRRTTEPPCWTGEPPPFLTARSLSSPARFVAPGSPTSVSRFDSKVSLDKGPALPPPSVDILQLQLQSQQQPMYPEHLYLAMDCEMVGVGPHHISVLARVSIVNFQGVIVYDSFVKVEEKVTDYRTAVSGIRPEDLRNGVPYGKCRSQVRAILAGKILIGHGLQNDLAVLNLRHPAHMIRDTSLYLPYMQDFGSGLFRSRSLRDLMRDFCGQTIQAGEHDSVEDARAVMTLFALAKPEWEANANMGFSAAAYNTSSSSSYRTSATTRKSSSSSRPLYNEYRHQYHLPSATFY